MRRNSSLVLLLLLICSCVAFVVFDGLLFPYVRLQLTAITELARLRNLAVTAAFLLREQVLSVDQNALRLAPLVRTEGQDQGQNVYARASKLGGQISALAAEMRQIHFAEYRQSEGGLGMGHEGKHSSQGLIVSIAVLSDGGWNSANMSFWEMGQEISRRLDHVSNFSVEFLHSIHAYEASSSPAEPAAESEDLSRMRSMAIYYENLLRAIFPAMERSVLLAERRLVSAEPFVIATSACSLVVLLLLLMCLASVVEHGNRRIVSKSHHALFACRCARVFLGSLDL